MKTLYLLPLLFLILVVNSSAQSNPDAQLCVGSTGSMEVEKAVGEDVRLCWETPYNEKFRYFRVRRSQSQEGFYDIVPGASKILLIDCWRETTPTSDVIHGTSAFKAVRTYHYFITTIWEDKDVDGVPYLRETVGSEHAKVTVK